MVQIESAWPKYPDYEINLAPRRRRRPGVVRRPPARRERERRSGSRRRSTSTGCTSRSRTCTGSTSTPSLNFTVCPFKGAATYWSLTAVDPVEKDIVWTYTTPFDEVGGIEGYVAFYQERVRIELEEHWPGDDPGPSSSPTGSPRGVTPPTCSG